MAETPSEAWERQVLSDLERPLSTDDIAAIHPVRLCNYINCLRDDQRVYTDFLGALEKHSKPADLRVVVQALVKRSGLRVPYELDDMDIPWDDDEDLVERVEVAERDFKLAEALNKERWKLCRHGDQRPPPLAKGMMARQASSEKNLVITPQGKVEREDRSEHGGRAIWDQISSTLLWKRLDRIFQLEDAGTELVRPSYQNTLILVHKDGCSTILFSRFELSWICSVKGSEEAHDHACKLLELVLADYFYREYRHPILGQRWDWG